MEKDNDNKQSEEQSNDEQKDSRKKQQQSDPQLTELKGFVDPNEDLEPKLEDKSEK